MNNNNNNDKKQETTGTGIYWDYDLQCWNCTFEDEYDEEDDGNKDNDSPPLPSRYLDTFHKMFVFCIRA